MTVAATVSTRDRLIETGLHLFYRNGFHAVGLDRILGEVGVTKTTFYNHFDSKDDLVLAVIVRRDAWWRTTFRRALRRRAGDGPREQLLSAFDVLHEWFSEEPFCGCMFINAAAEFPNPHDPAHKAAAENKRAIERHITNLAAKAGADDPAAFAAQFCLIMEGTIVTRQVTRDDRSAETGRRLAELLIQSHLPEAGGSQRSRPCRSAS